MNCKKINDFSELTKNEHKRILEAVNVVNKEICHIENWDFLRRRCSITLPAETSELENQINGKILHVFIDGKEYTYTEDLNPFLSQTNFNFDKYSALGSTLLFPKFNQEKTLDIIYYTSDCVADENGTEKENLEIKTDVSLIPMPFAEQLLVYGACLRVKANPQYFKFSYWLSMYKEALVNLKSKTLVSAQNTPEISVFRG